jgi:hypothetical protein
VLAAPGLQVHAQRRTVAEHGDGVPGLVLAHRVGQQQVTTGIEAQLVEPDGGHGR